MPKKTRRNAAFRPSDILPHPCNTAPDSIDILAHRCKNAEGGQMSVVLRVSEIK